MSIETTPRSKLGRLGAVGIGVTDLQKSLGFYMHVLGMVQLTTFKLPHMDEIVVGFEGARGAAVVLMHWTDGSPRNYLNNPVKLVFYMPDPKAVAQKARDAGFEVVREPEPVPSLGNAVVGFIKDPDGTLIELLQAQAATA